MRLTCIVYEDDQGIMETVVKKIVFCKSEFPTFAKYFPRRRWGKIKLM